MNRGSQKREPAKHSKSLRHQELAICVLTPPDCKTVRTARPTAQLSRETWTRGGVEKHTGRIKLHAGRIELYAGASRPVTLAITHIYPVPKGRNHLAVGESPRETVIRQSLAPTGRQR